MAQPADTGQWRLMVLITFISLAAAEQNTESGCADGSTEEFFDHKSIQACAGHWKGHVNNSSNICAPGWQVCSWKDQQKLKTITFKMAVNIPGCYAFNAAQDGGKCTQCTSDLEKDDLAGVGQSCPHQEPDQDSCLAGGRIAVSCCVDTHHKRACTYKPGISTGVLCCQMPDSEKASCNPRCQNGGTCVGDNKCNCAINYKGMRCQTAIKTNPSYLAKLECYRDKNCSCQGDLECLIKRKLSSTCSHACLNGGRCRAGRCMCPRGYYGTHCLGRVERYFLTSIEDKPS